MGKLSLAARNMIVQVPEVIDFVSTGLIGSDAVWADGWIFDAKPSVILDDKSYTCFIVFTQREWMDANPHNTMSFPMLNLDIWAAPSRDADNSVTVYDADDVIDTVFQSLRPYFHTVNKDVPGIESDPEIPFMGSPGRVRYWGTTSEISDRSGVPIVSSTHVGSSDYRDVVGGNGVRMRSFNFGVETF